MITVLFYKFYIFALIHSQVPGYLHGILVNETDKVCEYSALWMDRMLAIPVKSLNHSGNVVNVLH